MTIEIGWMLLMAIIFASICMTLALCTRNVNYNRVEKKLDCIIEWIAKS